MSDPLYSRITQSELFTSVKTLCSIRSCSEILEQTFFKSCTWRSENFSNWLRTHWKTEDPASQLPEHPLMKEPDSGLYWDCSLCYRGSWSASRRCKWLRPGSAEWGRTGPYILTLSGFCRPSPQLFLPLKLVKKRKNGKWKRYCTFLSNTEEKSHGWVDINHSSFTCWDSWVYYNSRKPWLAVLFHWVLKLGTEAEYPLFWPFIHRHGSFMVLEGVIWSGTKMTVLPKAARDSRLKASHRGFQE